MNQESIARVLQKSVLFQKLGPTQLLTAASISRVLVFREGTYIYRQKEPGDGFYVVAAGEVELVLSREKGGESVVGRIQPGGHFGETSLITGKPHSLGARACGDVILICFDRRVFQEALLSDATIHDQMNVALSERLRVSYSDHADSEAGGGKRGESLFRLEDFDLYFEGTDSEGENRRQCLACFHHGQTYTGHHQSLCKKS